MKQDNIFHGLSDSEVEESRKRYGNNVLTPPKRKSLPALFLAKFKDPLIQILILAGMVSIGISFYEYYGLGRGAEVFLSLSA